ncbi:tetratricopeptide repeat protein [Motilibacter peucedani]|uniref:Tetratricopeptide repeat protein n=1 Tax=Motilibacter peucedani TaxID=598650 RepID=A0A420XP07_9ACTN|nr:tetratricopeptide repeat protein [Motilibacter peucedani]RKS73939.1 tetratricopeptide repeat protein [Motilibacter peucedani]
MRRLIPVVAVVGLASALFLGAGIGWPSTRQSPPTVADSGVAGRASGDPASVIASLQAHLRAQPKDASSWAALGSEYVAQARVTSEPTYYPKAQEALETSLRVQPVDNVDASIGMAALTAARHDFTAALAWSRKALDISPTSPGALEVQVDALDELGRYDEALKAAHAADDVRPGVPTFTRLSYIAELHGDTREARRLMTLALENATLPDDKAFAHFHLGQLAKQDGDSRTAATEYAAALRAEPGYVPAMAYQAVLYGSSGQVSKAEALWQTVVDKMPIPEYLLAYGELLESQGRKAEAQDQYAVVAASAELARANGVDYDLEIAHYEADHGSPAEALRVAKAEWARRHSISSADALGWALHAAGRDREALPYLVQANRLGTKDSRVLYHLGMAQKGAGQRAAAVKTLRRALALDPTFSPLYAPAARRALTALGAT